MRVIDRLNQYIEQKHLVPYNFERVCGIANGYLKKQFKGKGSIGSEILEKISSKYADLSLIWLITGKGTMLALPHETHDPNHELREHRPPYYADERTVKMLHEKISILENALADKEKIIRLIETQTNKV